MGRRKSHKELIEVLWESHYGTRKVEEPQAPESPPTPPPAERPEEPVDTEEVDLERLEADPWEVELEAPAPRSTVPVAPAQGEPDTPTPRRERRATVRPGDAEKGGGFLIGVWLSKIRGMGQAIARSFGTTTVGEFLSRTVSFRFVTLLILAVGVILFGLLCYLMGQYEARERDMVRQYDMEDRGALIQVSEEYRSTTFRNVDHKPNEKGEARGAAAEDKTGETKKAVSSSEKAVPPAKAETYYVVRLASWSRRLPPQRHSEILENLREKLKKSGLQPVWAEDAGSFKIAFAGRFESQGEARAKGDQVRGLSVTGLAELDPMPIQRKATPGDGSR